MAPRFLEINLSGFLEKLLFGADVMPGPTPQSPSVCGVVMSVGMDGQCVGGGVGSGVYVC